MHGFATIRAVSDYQSRVPVSTFDDLEPLVRRVASGEANVLTREPVERLVPSAGSTSAAKLIPFTATLRREFSRAIDAWLFDLFAERPALMGGPAYWSITPAAAVVSSHFQSRIPVGFDDDSKYLGGARQALARAIMAVPPEVRLVRNADSFRYVTALFLLHARDLRLMSIWHPSFLELLFDTLEKDRDRLICDVRQGTITPPSGLTSSEHTSLPRPHPDARRAAILQANTSHNLPTIWPKLSLISCWGDGPACGPAEQLARRIRGPAIQPKGLLATEGVVTIPFAGCHPVAIRSHFFEFVEPGGAVRLAHELECGMEYTIVVTTGGGLYRYSLADRVRVDEIIDKTPSLRFIGKDDRVSDWFGEKLSEAFVAGVLESLFDAPRPRFAMVAPERTASGMAYTLYVDGNRANPSLSIRLEEALRRNPHYAWCVDVGQLRPARVVRVAAGAERYVDACAARGQRLGEIKPPALRPETGWGEVLRSGLHPKFTESTYMSAPTLRRCSGSS
jgi:hypothetical protein